MPAYKERWPVGSLVRVADSATLEKFAREWRYHHKLEPDQLNYAGQIARVGRVGYYHGGDVLYWLERVPGTWHECCLVEWRLRDAMFDMLHGTKRTIHG